MIQYFQRTSAFTPRTDCMDSFQAGEWRSLEDLNVRNNQLKALPSEMERWTSLKRLLAGGNGILHLPEQVGWVGCFGLGCVRLC